MKLARVYMYKYFPKLKIPYTLSNTSINNLDCFILRLKSDTGLEGLGEATTLETYTKETLSSINKCFSSAKLVKQDINSLSDIKKITDQHCFKQNYFAKAALETALFDLLAKHRNVDFRELVGKAHRKVLELVGNIGIHSLRETLALSDFFVARGFKTLKIKIGKDIRKDIEKIKLIVETFPNISLRIDANQGYNYEQTIQLSKSISNLNIEHIEQPLPVGHLKKYVKLRHKIKVPIMLDEDIFSHRDVKRVAKLKAADKIKSKLFKSGIFDTLKIAEICYQNNLDFVWGNGVESHIGAFAEMKLASAIKTINPICECIGPMKLRDNLTDRKFILKKSQVEIYDSIGLGLNLKAQDTTDY